MGPHCRTCHNDRLRAKRAQKRAVRVRRENRVKDRAERLALLPQLRKDSGPLGRQGDADRLLQVVALKQEIRRLEASTKIYRGEMNDLRPAFWSQTIPKMRVAFGGV